MKILHVIPTYLPALRYGGPMFAVHGLCRALARRGHEIAVYATNMDGAGELRVPLGTPVDRDGVAVSYFPVGSPRRLVRSPAMGRALQESINGFDVVHTHSVYSWPPWVAARSARRRGIPYVMSPRGMLVRELIRRRNPLAKKVWMRALETANLSSASALHFTSELERDEAGALGYPLTRAVVIPNGIEFAEAGERSADGDYILYLGRINWKKGLERLLQALGLEPGLKALLAGPDEDGYQAALERTAQRAALGERVRFLGPVYGSDKWALLRGARCLALLSDSENFGNAALEAMAAGCPVVLSEGVGLSTQVRAAECGFVVGNDPADAARALRTLWDDEALRARMGARGARLAKERYGWDAVAQHFENLYRSLLHGS